MFSVYSNLFHFQRLKLFRIYLYIYRKQIYIYIFDIYLFSVHVIWPCKAQGVLESTRGAAKHTKRCKAQRVLQSTRGAAKHKGCCKAHGVLSCGYTHFHYLYILYTYNMYFSIYVYVYLGRNNCSQQIAPNEVFQFFYANKSCYLLSAHDIWSCACFKAPESEATVWPLNIATPSQLV